MYIFFFSYMHKLKVYVRNKARPEGSIAEGYIDNECLSFCSLYYNDIETLWNRRERNYDVPDTVDFHNKISVFQPTFRRLSGPIHDILSETDWEKLSWYVLNNCVEVHPYLR